MDAQQQQPPKAHSINPQAAEILAAWYLRFNGYFIVENFIVDAADAPEHNAGGVIVNHTETDLLGMRRLYSREVTGGMEIKNDLKLINGTSPLTDYLIAEVKTGKSNKPNSTWRDKKLKNICYVLRFMGIVETENKIEAIAEALAEKGMYAAPENLFSVRFIVISETALNKNWPHLVNISFDEIIRFLVTVRGRCWVEEELGTRSRHDQWHPLINHIFAIANEAAEPDHLQAKIKSYLCAIDNIQTSINFKQGDI